MMRNYHAMILTLARNTVRSQRREKTKQFLKGNQAAHRNVIYSPLCGTDFLLKSECRFVSKCLISYSAGAFLGI